MMNTFSDHESTIKKKDDKLNIKYHTIVTLISTETEQSFIPKEHSKTY